MRTFHRNKEAIYPLEEWMITEKSFAPKHHHHSETVFALGNGYMGVRGNFEEGVPEGAESTPGTYINGFYETEPIIYGEFAPNQPKEFQTMINVTNWISMGIKVSGRWFSFSEGTLHQFQRTLDLRGGTLRRTLVWESPEGDKLQIDSERYVSQTEQHLGALRYTVTPIKVSGTIEIHSWVNGDVKNYHHLRHQALQVTHTEWAERSGWVESQTKNTRFQLLCGFAHSIQSSESQWSPEIASETTDTAVHWWITFEGQEGQSYTVDKFAALGTELDMDREQLRPTLQAVLNGGLDEGYEKTRAAHKAAWEKYWEDTDVEIFGDALLQQGFRFNAFHLYQSTGRNGRTNVAAKGLTGEYYEGHYFWDTETYIIPFFLYSQPDLVRQLLLYRYNILDHARANARRMRNKGALYAWRTIDGREASGNFLGSTVQYHINADVAYAIHKYLEASRDEEFLIKYGAEVLFETARCWADRGFFSERRDGKYVINEVSGPDEYKPGVNNNCYTNYMAKFNLEQAVQAYRHLERRHPETLASLADRIELEPQEVDLWIRCARDMYLPYDEDLGIHPQDDSFLDKDPIDVDTIAEADIPLVGNWHPLVIWRYQIIKQADVVLLQFLLGHEFTLNEKRRDFDYYEPKTTHDSSLSSAIYSIMAAEIGYSEYAGNYFRQTARLDLDDYNKNAWQGIHTACMAGSWMCVVNGFAGMRTHQGQLKFKPMLPASLTGYQFKVKFQQRQLQVRVADGYATYSLLTGAPLTVHHKGQSFTISQGSSQTYSL